MNNRRRHEIFNAIIHEPKLVDFLQTLSNTEIIEMQDGLLLDDTSAPIQIFYRLAMEDGLQEAFDLIDIPGTDIFKHTDSFGVPLFHLICNQYYPEQMTPAILNFVQYAAGRVQDINATGGRHNFTASHFAVQSRLIHILRILADHGADLTIKNSKGMNCDEIAARMNVSLVKSNHIFYIDFYKQYIAFRSEQALKSLTIDTPIRKLTL